MARLHVHLQIIDDAGAQVLDVELDEPTRISVARDPLFVTARLESLVNRALLQAHDSALRLHRETDRGGVNLW